MKKILFVDDEALLALGAEDTLRIEGYDVAIAFDGEQALELANAFAPDVVVTDLMMPRLDGAGLAKALVASGLRAPIVVQTAVPEGDLPAAVRGLFAEYLSKPLHDRQLLDCIARLVGE